MSPASGPELSYSPGPGRRRRPWLIASAAVLVVAALASVSAVRETSLDGVRVEEGLVYRVESPGTCRLDLYWPEGNPPAGGWPVVVAIHGGGWSGGSFRGYGRSVARLSRHGLAVASVGYHLSSHGKPAWPRNRDDVRESVRWLRRHAEDYALNPDRIAVMGASAGGHLAALLGTDPGPETNGESAHVSAVIDFYGPADLAGLADVPNARAALRGLLGGSPATRPRLAEAASPVKHVSGEDPPMLLIHGTKDPTVPVEQSRKLAQALEDAGVSHRLIEVEGAAHGFGLKTSGHDFLPEILEFLASCWDDTQRYRSSEPHSAASGTPSLVPDRPSTGP